jgi:pimeloyl-ACP methyl ester carboxylesterase
VIRGVAKSSIQEHLLGRVSKAFTTLPERYLGAEEGFEATYQIRLGDIGRTWEVRARPDRCDVYPSPGPRSDVVIGTDATTWLALREGKLSGLDAFAQRRLYARGNLDLAVGFEGLFRLPDDRPPLLRIHDVRVEGGRISSLTAGTGSEHVLLLHGLGGNKASFFETVAALSPDYTVHAVDLPGFGSSSKPTRAAYNASYFAQMMIRFLDTLAIDRAHIVGNSMGGRAALEIALTSPQRVRTLGLLAPAVAFRRRREFWPLVKFLRPELAAIPHPPIREDLVKAQIWGLFARPERLDPSVADIACDEFRRNYRSRSARIAFYASARNIYLDRPLGDDGFWTRLEGLEPPALFIWGDQDKLVPAKFSRHVENHLPSARQVVLENCGHVPQMELPERTNRLLRDHIASQHRGAVRARRRLKIA